MMEAAGLGDPVLQLKCIVEEYRLGGIVAESQEDMAHVVDSLCSAGIVTYGTNAEGSKYLKLTEIYKGQLYGAEIR